MTTLTQANLLTLRKLVIVACVMFAFGFALVPFYKRICEVIGINSVFQAEPVVNTQVDATRLVTIELDSNLRSNLPWTFRALQAKVSVHPGELTTVMFEISNNSERAVTAQAIPSFGPQIAGRYFKKLECFCFTQQTLKPGEARQMPVVFVVETGLPQDINTVTLSYSFFEVEGTAKKAG